jgi:hypothetical protein
MFRNCKEAYEKWKLAGNGKRLEEAIAHVTALSSLSQDVQTQIHDVSNINLTELVAFKNKLVTVIQNNQTKQCASDLQLLYRPTFVKTGKSFANLLDGFCATVDKLSAFIKNLVQKHTKILDKVLELEPKTSSKESAKLLRTIKLSSTETIQALLAYLEKRPEYTTILMKFQQQGVAVEHRTATTPHQKPLIVSSPAIATITPGPKQVQEKYPIQVLPPLDVDAAKSQQQDVRTKPKKTPTLPQKARVVSSPPIAPVVVPTPPKIQEIHEDDQVQVLPPVAVDAALKEADSSPVCRYNPESKRTIYHLVSKAEAKRPLDVTKSYMSEYNKIIHDTDAQLERDLLKVLEPLAKEGACDENIVIYGSSVNEDISESVNNALEKVFADPTAKKLMNVTIIHETNDSRKMLFMIYNQKQEQMVRKIVNVFPVYDCGSNKQPKIEDALILHVDVDTVPNPTQRLKHSDRTVTQRPYTTYYSVVSPSNINNNGMVRRPIYCDSSRAKSITGSGLMVPKFFNMNAFLFEWDPIKNEPPIPTEVYKVNHSMSAKAVLEAFRGRYNDTVPVLDQNDNVIRNNEQLHPAPPMVKIPKQRYGTIVFQFRNTNNSNNILEDQWWFKWYFNVPPCANGRLVQASSTCWFNTSMNTVMLSPTIAKLLVAKYHKIYPTLSEPDRKKLEATFDSCINPKTALRLMIMAVVKNVFIKNKRMTANDANFSRIMAARVATIYKDKSSDYKFSQDEIQSNATIQNLSEGEGGYVDQGLRLVLSSMFDSKDEFNAIFCKHKTISGKLVNQTELMDASSDKPFTIKKLSDWNILSTPVNIAPNILLIIPFGQSKTPPEIVVLLDTEYTLESAAVSLDGHVVSALRCGKESYIYDSNNYLAKTDWIHGDYSGYINALKENGVRSYGQSPKVFKGLKALIYVRSDLRKAAATH